MPKPISFRSINSDGSLGKYSYKDDCWISKQFKDVWAASPIYDWSNSDVWHANYL